MSPGDSSNETGLLPCCTHADQCVDSMAIAGLMRARESDTGKSAIDQPGENPESTKQITAGTKIRKTVTEQIRLSEKALDRIGWPPGRQI